MPYEEQYAPVDNSGIYEEYADQSQLMQQPRSGQRPKKSKIFGGKKEKAKGKATVEEQPAAAPEPERPADISGMRLLVAEDNDLNREIVAYLLEDAGAHADFAVNGQEAVDAFAASAPNHYDAVLMDIMMPVLDGLETARKIRQLPRPDAGAVPIIAMTANAFAEDQQKASQAGMNDYLTKPLEVLRLHATLAKYRS